MPEPVTYYHRDGKDYAVFAYDLAQLHGLRAWIRAIPGQYMSRPGAALADDDVSEAIGHLEARQRGTREEDPGDGFDLPEGYHMLGIKTGPDGTLRAIIVDGKEIQSDAIQP